VLLEALGLERHPPDTRFFEDLFLRFQRRVACETLTRAAADPAVFDAEAFFAEWVEEERGLVGEERARAFAWLAGNCKFEVVLAHGEARRPWNGGEDSSNGERGGAHRAVIASIGGRRILADAAYPLPVLLPLDASARDFPTGFGTLTVKSRAGDGDIRVTCDARGEETELVRVDFAANPSPLPLKGISRTLQGDSPRPEAHGSFALRVLDDRVLFWRAGRMTILDAWSRLEYPLPGSERAAIAKLFALELDGISMPEEAREKEREPATLSVFHLSPVAPLEARKRAGRDPVPLLLVSSREERVEAAAGGSLISIRATLADVPPAGPGEAVRKTLVFHLVSELFELSNGEGGTR
jgi:hypothetical protein